MSVELDWRSAYREIKLLNWIILPVMTLSGLAFGRTVAAGILLGGLTIIANFALLQKTIRRAFSSDGAMTAGKAAVVVKYYARLLGLAVIIFVLVGVGWADPIGLAVGLSTVVLSIFVFGLRRALRMTVTRRFTTTG